MHYSKKGRNIVNEPMKAELNYDDAFLTMSNLCIKCDF